MNDFTLLQQQYIRTYAFWAIIPIIGSLPINLNGTKSNTDYQRTEEIQRSREQTAINAHAKNPKSTWITYVQNVKTTPKILLTYGGILTLIIGIYVMNISYNKKNGINSTDSYQETFVERIFNWIRYYLSPAERERIKKELQEQERIQREAEKRERAEWQRYLQNFLEHMALHKK